MKLVINNNEVVLFQNQETDTDLSEYFNSNLDNLKSNNLVFVVDHHQDLSNSFLNLISKISKIFQNNNKSFVVVSSKFSYNDFPDSINLAPTQQEALDFIEMEEMQRDLEL